MPNLSLKDVVQSRGAIERIGASKVKAALAFRLARLIRHINPELESFEAARMALLERVGMLEDGGNWHVPPEAREEFNEEMAALLETEIQIDFKPFAINDLPNISTADAMALWWLVADDCES